MTFFFVPEMPGMFICFPGGIDMPAWTLAKKNPGLLKAGIRRSFPMKILCSPVYTEQVQRMAVAINVFLLTSRRQDTGLCLFLGWEWRDGLFRNGWTIFSLWNGCGTEVRHGGSGTEEKHGDGHEAVFLP